MQGSIRVIKGMILLLVCLAPVLGAWAEPPTVEARKLTGRVTIDGKLNEKDWTEGPWSGGFHRLKHRREQAPAPGGGADTRFKIRYDDGALYVGVICHEPLIDKLKAEAIHHDAAVWSDDCVELFFDPENVGRYYHHLIVNSKGVVFDEFAADFGLVHRKLWNCAFESAGTVDKKRKLWTVEMRIPFASMRLGDKPGTTWKLNVARERHTTGKTELYTWSPIPEGKFHQPRLFGSVTGLEVNFAPFRFESTEPRVSVARAASGIKTLHMATDLVNSSGAPRKLVGKAWLLDEPSVNVQTEPVTVPDGGQATITFPPMELRSKTGRLKAADTRGRMVFSFEAAEGDRVYHRLVKDLSIEYRPIRIEVLRPVYRNTIYATQKLEKLGFRVSVSMDMARLGNHVLYKLASADGKTMVDGGRLDIGKLDRDVHINVKDIPVGTYVLEASVLDEAGEVLQKSAVTLARLPAPARGNEVRIDEHRNVLVDGKPWFGLGWYGSVPVDDPRDDVVALQNFSTPTVVRMVPEPDFETYRKLYREHGIMRVIAISNRRLVHSFALYGRRADLGKQVKNEITTDAAPSPETAAMLKELVEAVRGEPWLLGYYISDEPEIHNFRSDYLENQYKLMKELDPYHPVMITNLSVDGIVTHGVECADILAPDPYNPNFDYVPNFMKKIAEVGPRGKATYVTLWHSASDTHFTKPFGSARPYPYHVFRNQYLASMVYGCKGYAAYISAFFFPEPEYYIGLPYVWREMRLLEKPMMAPAPAEPLQVKASAPMGTWIRRHDGKLYLVVVNHKPGKREAVVSHPALKDVTELVVVSGQRKVKVTDGRFTDSFEEGDAHIYTTDPAGEAFPSTEKVRAAIDAFKQKVARPGNLLHLSKGTFLRAAPGYYAPWFDQYYFYACNGITFDKGWTVLKWDGASSWLEVLMKDKAPVGRIVVHTPNISDYTIELHDGDRWQTVVTEKGNQKDKVEHVLEEPVDTIKLRVTVTGTREGNPTLSEIEAYSK